MKGNRGILGLLLQEGDNLVNVAISSGKDDIAIFSSDGYGILFNEYYQAASDESDDAQDSELENADAADDVEEVEAELVDDATDDDGEGEDDANAQDQSAKVRPATWGLRPCGRNSRGVRGMKVHAGAKVVTMLVLDHAYSELLFAFARGFGKRVLLSEFNIGVSRGRAGNKVVGRLDRNGELIGVVQVNENDGLIMINNSGNLVRTRVDGILRYSRVAQGVKLVTLDDGASLVNIARVVGEEDDVENSLPDEQATNEAGTVVADEAQNQEAQNATLEKTPNPNDDLDMDVDAESSADTTDEDPNGV